MVRRSVIVILFFCTLSLFLVAQEVPTVIQPREAGYSPAQLSALEEAINRLGAVLNSSNLGSKRELGSSGWALETFAAYTAGTLERLGYETAIVSREVEESGTKLWVVVRVDLGGAIAWIPVEPLPNPDMYQTDLGNVPLVATLVYDSSYLSYDTVIELPPNIPPTAVIHESTRDIVETKSSAWFGHTSSDPDGEIVLFQWTYGGVRDDLGGRRRKQVRLQLAEASKRSESKMHNAPAVGDRHLLAKRCLSPSIGRYVEEWNA